MAFIKTYNLLCIKMYRKRETIIIDICTCKFFVCTQTTIILVLNNSTLYYNYNVSEPVTRCNAISHSYKHPDSSILLTAKHKLN